MTEPFDWALYLDHAKELAQRQEEGMHRLAIHAAYYGAFNVARIYVEHVLRIATPTTGDAHHFVWSTLERHKRNASLNGRRLAKIRRNADYDDPFPGRLSLEVQNALRWAAEIIAELPSD